MKKAAAGRRPAQNQRIAPNPPSLHEMIHTQLARVADKEGEAQGSAGQRRAAHHAAQILQRGTMAPSPYSTPYIHPLSPLRQQREEEEKNCKGRPSFPVSQQGATAVNQVKRAPVAPAAEGAPRTKRGQSHGANLIITLRQQKIETSEPRLAMTSVPSVLCAACCPPADS